MLLRVWECVVTAPKPLRGAALHAARNTRPTAAGLPVLPTDLRQDGDRRYRPDTSPAPESVRDLLHTRGVTIAPDEQRQAVVIVLPLDLANDLIPLTPDPLQAALACRLIESYL